MHSQMQKLYSSIIESFIQQAQKQYKDKTTLTSQQIGLIKSNLIHKIKNSQSYQHSIINDFFQKTSAHQPQVQQTLQPKKSKQQKKKQETVQFPLSKIKSLDDQEDDDLHQFQKISQKEIQDNKAKIQQLSQSHKSEQLYQIDSQDDDFKLRPQQLNLIKENTGLHILGSYNTKDKKFNSKKQEIKLTIYNALLKVEGHEQQILFPAVQLIATAASKSQLKI